MDGSRLNRLQPPLSHQSPINDVKFDRQWNQLLIASDSGMRSIDLKYAVGIYVEKVFKCIFAGKHRQNENWNGFSF